MTERERMIELIIQAALSISGNSLPASERLGMLADYLLENGVILPPCKIGDEVYRVSKRYGTWAVLPRFVSCIMHSTNCQNENQWLLFTTTTDVLGVTVFLTREEAKAAIRRRERKLTEVQNE